MPLRRDKKRRPEVAWTEVVVRSCSCCQPANKENGVGATIEAFAVEANPIVNRQPGHRRLQA
jgi:hypothetical protein